MPPGPVVTKNGYQEQEYRTNQSCIYHVINHKEFVISNDCINYRDNSELMNLLESNKLAYHIAIDVYKGNKTFCEKNKCPSHLYIFARNHLIWDLFCTQDDYFLCRKSLNMGYFLRSR